MTKKQEVNQIDQLRQRYEEAKNLPDKLTAKRAKVLEKVQLFDARLAELKAQRDAAEIQLDDFERKFLCDEILQSDITTHRDNVQKLRNEIKEVEKNQQLAVKTSRELSDELRAAGERLEGARRELCKAVRDDLMAAIQADERLQNQLLEVSAAIRTSQVPMDWGQMVAAIFREPGHSDKIAAIEAFSAKHGL